MALYSLSNGNFTIDFDNTSYIMKQFRPEEAEIELNKIEKIQGSTYISSTLKDRKIEIDFYVFANNEEDMLAKRRAIQQCVAPFEEVTLRKGEYFIKCYATSTIHWPPQYSENNPYATRGIITLRALDPYWHIAQANISDHDVIKRFKLPFSPQPGDIVGDLVSEVVIRNNGSNPYEPFKLRVTFTGSPTLSTITFSNTADGLDGGNVTFDLGEHMAQGTYVFDSEALTLYQEKTDVTVDLSSTLQPSSLVPFSAGLGESVIYCLVANVTRDRYSISAEYNMSYLEV